MPTNEQRRQTAKRKLERQLENRAERARKQRIWAISGVAVVAVVAAVAITAWFAINKGDKPSEQAQAAPAAGEVECTYPAAGAAAKKVDPPRSGKIPNTPAQISMSMKTNQGNIGLELDNARATCTVNSFVSLAQKGFFDNTTCHRITGGGQLSVLQCGDPTGTGTGGPGYQFTDEYPVTPGDSSSSPIDYPAGTLAMANSGPNTNGSQFFMVYADSKLPPNYTKFGTIDKTGLDTLAKIAKNGIKPGARGSSDGEPAQEVKIIDLQLD